MMKLPFKERVFLSIVVLGLAAMLVTLAILQYHWSNEISAAAGARLQANLSSSMQGWREDLDREIVGVFAALQANPMLPRADKLAQYAQQYQTWSQSAAHPNLVSHVFLVEKAGTEQAQLLQLNTAANQFEAAEWPTGLAKLHTWINDRSRDFVTVTRHPDRMHSMRLHDELHPGAGGGGAFPNRRLFGFDLATIDLQELAGVRPQFSHGKDGIQIGWAIISLDRNVLQEHVLPELAERYFTGSETNDYETAVVALPGSSLLYSSDPEFGKTDTASLDGTMPVFGPPRGAGINKGLSSHQAGSARRAPDHSHHERRELGFAGPVRIVPLPLGGADNDWQLLVRHRRGSLEAVVAGMRRRNLTLGFGVLLVLSAGIAIILISSQRARFLARLQMDFVAGVSHELRTPLAVISSAAENIADGVVGSREQLSQYGTEIKNQARHLIQLVEQILLFAASREKRQRYNVRPLRVGDVIEAALKDTAGLIESAGVTVEQEIALNLPPIMGDLPALSHCLQNLITNAVKYGGEARWMRIKANAHEQHGSLEELEISVEDRGLGIGAGELRHIFEPFYRGHAASSAQIHGTGLGLSLARDIAEAMDGRLTVSSEPGKGSCFTVYLRFADISQLQAASQPAAAVSPKLSKT